MPGKTETEAQRRERILQAAFKVALRERLEHMTIRQVAAEANLSHELVFSYFKSKDALLVALLDWLLDDLFETWEAPTTLSPRERLLELIEQDLRDACIQHNQKSLTRLELLFDYWTLSTREPEIRCRMLAGIERSRQMFLPVACSLIKAEPTRFPGVTPDTLVTLILSLIQGYTLQNILGNPIPPLTNFSLLPAPPRSSHPMTMRAARA
ncbi:TetR/AcrR family transcriptional regulator [Dictyobacter kobayashii]|uniref:HTH tetR-type domain-containing protein n=1 Tax=Dictyobacter kobayashii TaxID=2014872 RepID=A0A402ARV8_9CHLR|nr:TetR/AcrR family transcriptional regulator [Dictyobacter kobayashii]GCE21835.1 hypothetical protein KDK_56350 [Dictyobacter kobayashii]